MRTHERVSTTGDPADAFIVAATTKHLMAEITNNHGVLACPIPGYKQFVSLTIPESFRVTSLGFSKNGVHVVDFNYLDTSHTFMTVPMVAKPLDKEAFNHERAVYTRLLENPVPFPFFRPVFFVELRGGCYLGTKAEPNCVPLSHLLKQVFHYEHEANRLLSAYHRISASGALALLRLHALGILHDDWQPKNFGIDTRTGRVFVYDFERSQVTDNRTFPIDAQSSIDEIQNFLDTGTFYALQGYLPDDLVNEGSDSPVQSKRKRAIQLRSLGLSKEHFKSVNESIRGSCVQYYTDAQKRHGHWSSVEHGFMQALLFQKMSI